MHPQDQEEVVSPPPNTGQERQTVTVGVVIESTPTDDGDSSPLLDKKHEQETKKKNGDTIVQDLEGEDQPLFDEEPTTEPTSTEVTKTEPEEEGASDHQGSGRGSEEVLKVESVQSVERELMGGGAEEAGPGSNADTANASELDRTIVTSSDTRLALSLLAKDGLVTDQLKSQSATLVSVEHKRPPAVRTTHSQADIDKKRSQDLKVETFLAPPAKKSSVSNLHGDAESGEHVKSDSLEGVGNEASIAEGGLEGKAPGQMEETDGGGEASKVEETTSSSSMKKSEDVPSEDQSEDKEDSGGKDESKGDSEAERKPTETGEAPPPPVGDQDSPPTEPPPTMTQPPAPTETQPPVPTETQPPAPTETEPPVPTETQPPAPTETEPPAPTETEPPAPTETEPLAPTETQPPASTKTQPPASIETEHTETGEKPVTDIPDNNEGNKEGSNVQAPPPRPSPSMSKRTEDSDSRKIEIDHTTGQSSTAELGGGETTPSRTHTPAVQEVPAAV